MVLFIIVLLLATGTVAISIFLRKKRIKDNTFPSHSSLPTISPKPRDQPTRKASLPDVRIVYEDARGDQTERRITPLHRSASGVITAHCHLRNDERTFRLDRIRIVYDSRYGQSARQTRLDRFATRSGLRREAHRRIYRTSNQSYGRCSAGRDSHERQRIPGSGSQLNSRTTRSH